MEDPVIQPVQTNQPNREVEPEPLKLITASSILSMVPKKFWAFLAIVVVVTVFAGTYKMFPAKKSGVVSKPPLTDKVIPPIVAVPALSVAKNSKVGNYLVAKNGMTLYRYTKDANGKSNCLGECILKRPPYLFTDDISISNQGGINGKIGVVARADGKTQMTYNGAPLYFFVKDTKQGDLTGQGLNNEWFVVKP